MINKKKLILLENKHQTEEYIKNIQKFRDYLPISFDFNSTELLKKNKIKFKESEEFEKDSVYKGISTSSFKLTERIYEYLNLEYKDIELHSLFYYQIYTLIAYSKKCSKILKKILKKERPEKIIVFKNVKKSFYGEESISYIISKLFKGKIYFAQYSLPNKANIRENLFIKIGGKVQNLHAKINLKLTKKSDNKIFISGGKPYFKSITDKLVKNKKNKIFNFDSALRKSYFSGGKFLPFYEISGQNSPSKFNFEKEIRDMLEKLNGTNLSKLGLEKEIETNLKLFLHNLIKLNFFKIFLQINEVYSLFEKRKLNLILLTEEDSPISKIMIRVANKFNIPSLVFLHGIPAGEILFGSPESTYFLVFGEKIKMWSLKNFARYKKTKTKIKTLGCPRYDSLKRSNKKPLKQILYAMEVAPKIERISDTHLTEKNQKNALKIIIQTVKKNFPKHKLIFKIRPGWDLAKLPAIVSKEEEFENYEIIERADNVKLMDESEIIIINHTTMGLEALLLKKPVISVSFKELDHVNPYKKTGLIDITYNSNQLKVAIEKILNKENKENKILSNYICTDRKSTERAINFINNLLI